MFCKVVKVANEWGEAGGCQGQSSLGCRRKATMGRSRRGAKHNISHRESWRTNVEWIALASRNGNTGLVFLVSSSLGRPKSLHEPGRSMLGALETRSMT